MVREGAKGKYKNVHDVGWQKEKENWLRGQYRMFFKNTLECKYLNSFTEIKRMTCTESHVYTHIPCWTGAFNDSLYTDVSEGGAEQEKVTVSKTHGQQTEKG